MNARQIGGTLTPPGVYGFQLGVERRDPNRLVAILGALFQSCQEFARRFAAVRGRCEEEIVFRVPEGQHALDHVADGQRRHLVDARAPGWPGAREDDLPDQLRFFLRDHLRDETAKGETQQVDLSKTEGPDEGHCVRALGFVDLSKTEGPDEGHCVPRHRLHGRGSLTFRRANALVVEDDDAASRRDAVDDPGIPPVEFRSQMVEEDNRHSGVGPKLPVDQFRPADIDAFGRRIPPRDARSRMRLCLPAHVALQGYRGPTPPRQLHHFHRSLVTTDGESFHANTEARCGDATGASSRRFLRIPASNAPAGANRRNNRRRVARPPAVYRSFGRAALAASSTTSATTPGSSAVSRTALNCLLTAARASRYSSSFASGSSKFASKCVFVYAGSMTEPRIPLVRRSWSSDSE